MIEIQLNGYNGSFLLDEIKYENFKKILNIDTELLLDIIDISKIAIPIISINEENINEEGPIPYSHIKTKIGEKRFYKLINDKIIIKKIIIFLKL